MDRTARQVSQSLDGDAPKFSLKAWIQIVFIAIMFALILRTYVIQAFKVPNASMENSILVGDYILGDKITYKTRPPQKGEVVIFTYPLNPDKIYIKRCVAVAGDTVVIRDKVLFVNCCPFPDPLGVKYTDVRSLSGIYSSRDNYGPKVVPGGHIFVIGDNRDNSQDSRFWGFLPLENLKARPLFIYFSLLPDPDAPQYESIIDIFAIMFHGIYSIPGRIRTERIGEMSL